jgi:N-methylhydantoinase B
VEALEMAYPLRVEDYALIPGSGGAGQRRGGLGIRRRIRVLVDETVLSLQTDRRIRPPRGILGGADARVGRNMLVSGGKERVLTGKGTWTLAKDDIVVVESPGGGGYGDPKGRSKEDLGRDRKLGKCD